MSDLTPEERALGIVTYINYQGPLPDGDARTEIARQIRAAVEAERNQKNVAYDERNCLVAWLASLFPSSLERHPEEDRDWEDDWRWIVFIDGPTGQLSWHVHDSEIHAGRFNHLPRFQGRSWDGHTTEEKYERIAAAIREEPK